MSGYRFARAPAVAIASSTAGNGAKWLSLEASGAVWGRDERRPAM